MSGRRCRIVTCAFLVLAAGRVLSVPFLTNALFKNAGEPRETGRIVIMFPLFLSPPLPTLCLSAWLHVLGSRWAWRNGNSLLVCFTTFVSQRGFSCLVASRRGSLPNTRQDTLNMAEGGDVGSRVRRTQDDSPYSVNVGNIPKLGTGMPNTASSIIYHRIRRTGHPCSKESAYVTTPYTSI